MLGKLKSETHFNGNSPLDLDPNSCNLRVSMRFSYAPPR